MPNSTIWDFWADKYEKLWVQKYSLGPSRKAIIHTLIPMMNTNKKYKLLDMGCGTGQMLRELKQTFKGFDIEYTGVDISSKMIEKCREQDTDTTYLVSNIEDFQGEAESYDFIICSHSFPYYSDKTKAIEKFRHLLKKEGVLLLVQASANSAYDSIAMFFVKFTTSKAQYLSIQEILCLTKHRLTTLDTVKIKEKPYMPTICLFVLKKDGGQ